MQAIVAHVNMVVSAFSSEAFISNADAVLAAEDARAAAGNLQCADRGSDSWHNHQSQSQNKAQNRVIVHIDTT